MMQQVFSSVRNGFLAGALLVGLVALAGCGAGADGSGTTLSGDGPFNDVPIPIPGPGGGGNGGGGNGGGGNGGGGNGGGGNGGGGNGGGGKGPPAPPPAAPSWAMPDVVALAADPISGVLYGVDRVTGVLWTKADTDVDPVPGGVTIPGVRGLAWNAALSKLQATVDGGAAPDELIEIDPATFAVTPIGPVGTHTRLEGLAFLASINTLFSVDTDTDELVAIDPATGAPTVMGPVGGFGDIDGLASDDLGSRLWGTDSQLGVMVELDPVTGAATQVAETPEGNMAGLAHLPADGRFYGVDDAQGRLFLMDPAGTQIHAIEIRGLAFSATDGFLHGSHVGYASLVRIDPQTGWRQYGAYLGVAQIESLAFDAAANQLYGIASDTSTLYRIDAAGGTAPVGVVQGPGGPWSTLQGLACGAGVLYAFDGATGDVIQIDPTNASAILLGPSGLSGVQSLAYDAASGLLHVYSDAVQTHFQFSPASVASPVAVAPAARPSIAALAWDSIGERLWGSAPATDEIAVIYEVPAPPGFPYGDVHALAEGSGGFLYGFDVGVEALFRIEPAGQNVEELEVRPGEAIEAMAYDEDNDRVFMAEANGQRLLVLDAALQVAQIGANGALGTAGIKAMAYDRIGAQLYGVDLDAPGGATLVTIDTTDGTVAPFATPVGFDSVEAMVYDPVSALLLAVDRDTRQLLTIDPTTGAGAVHALLDPQFADVRGMAIGPGGVQLRIVDATLDVIVEIDKATGQVVP